MSLINGIELYTISQCLCVCVAHALEDKHHAAFFFSINESKCLSTDCMASSAWLRHTMVSLVTLVSNLERDICNGMCHMLICRTHSTPM